uniref:Uncharacterized protein n=1 Tax=Cannabis sativa TaxID=3483 RepID=A0A803QDP8_CANSA
MRFRQIDFGLNTGLRMCLKEEEIEAKSSDRLVRTYFERRSGVHLDTLLLQLHRCKIKDGVYKLGLRTFVNDVFVSKDGNVQVWPDMLKFADDLEFFFKYLQGERTFCTLMWYMSKDMHYYKDNVEKKKGRKVAQEAKYTVHGYVPAKQYWTYEVIEKVGKKYDECGGTRFPRMIN